MVTSARRLSTTAASPLNGWKIVFFLLLVIAIVSVIAAAYFGYRNGVENGLEQATLKNPMVADAEKIIIQFAAIPKPIYSREFNSWEHVTILKKMFTDAGFASKIVIVKTPTMDLHLLYIVTEDGGERYIESTIIGADEKKNKKALNVQVKIGEDYWELNKFIKSGVFDGKIIAISPEK